MVDNEHQVVFGTLDLEPPEWLSGKWSKALCRDEECFYAMYQALKCMLSEKKGWSSRYQDAHGKGIAQVFGALLHADTTSNHVMDYLAVLENARPKPYALEANDFLKNILENSGLPREEILAYGFVVNNLAAKHLYELFDFVPGVPHIDDINPLKFTREDLFNAISAVPIRTLFDKLVEIVKNDVAG